MWRGRRCLNSDICNDMSGPVDKAAQTMSVSVNTSGYLADRGDSPI